MTESPSAMQNLLKAYQAAARLWTAVLPKRVDPYVEAARGKVEAFLHEIGMNRLPDIKLRSTSKPHLTFTCEIEDVLWVFQFAARMEMLSFAKIDEWCESGIGPENLDDLTNPPSEEELKARALRDFDKIRGLDSHLSDVVPLMRKHLPALNELIGKNSYDEALAILGAQREKYYDFVGEEGRRRRILEGEL